MKSGEQAALPPWANGNKQLETFLRGLVWGELAICLGFHAFWVLVKSWPLAAESTSGALLLAGASFGVALMAALLLGIRPFRAAFFRIEGMLHGSAAVVLFALLAYLTLRDPFDPWFPYSWPMALWSVGVGFVLLANVVTLARLTRPNARPCGVGGMVHIAAVGLMLWCVLLAVLSGMTWPAYFWTIQIVFHAVLALPKPRRTWEPLRTPAATRATTLLELLSFAVVVLLCQLRSLPNITQIGTLEPKFIEALAPFTEPAFVLGVVTLLLAARFRITAPTHIAAAGMAMFAPVTAPWAMHFAMGYAVAVLFLVTHRVGSLSIVITTALMGVVWILSLLSYSLVGLIMMMPGALAFVEQIITLARWAAPALVLAWLALAWLNRRRGIAVDAAPAPLRAASPWAAGALYTVLAALLLVAPVAVLREWYQAPVTRAAQTAITEPCGACHAGYSGSDTEYAELNELGIELMRVDFSWSRIQPDPDTWNFSRWDGYLEAANKHGVKVLALLNFDNDAVEQSPEGSARDRYIAPEDLPLFLEYVRRTVEQYKDRVYAWEIWNEPDVARFWTGTPEEFYELERQTAAAVRAAAPHARILGSAVTGPMGVWTTPMMEGQHASGALRDVDHPTAHLYIPDPRAYYNEYAKVVAIARKHGHPGAPWVTETGDPDGGNYFWRASSALLAEHVIKSHVIATSLGIEKVIWYCYHDSGLASQIEKPGNSEAFFGLVHRDGAWKPAAHAYRLFSKHCSESALREDLVHVNGGLGARSLRTALYQKENGERALILWLEPMLRPDAHARVHLDLGNVDGTPVMHDIGSAYTKPLLDTVVDISETPVFITFTTGDSEAPIQLTVVSGPADGAWLALLGGLLLFVLASYVWRPARQAPENKGCSSAITAVRTCWHT